MRRANRSQTRLWSMNRRRYCTQFDFATRLANDREGSGEFGSLLRLCRSTYVVKNELAAGWHLMHLKIYAFNQLIN